MRGSVINRTVHLSGPIDVHVISHEAAGPCDGRRPARPAPSSVVLAGPATSPACRLAARGDRDPAADPAPRPTSASRPACRRCCSPISHSSSSSRPSAVRGRRSSPPWPRSCVPTGSSRRHSTQWTIAEGENVIALFVFLGIALGVSRIVDTAAPTRHRGRPGAQPCPHTRQVGGDHRRRGSRAGAAAEPAIGVRARCGRRPAP